MAKKQSTAIQSTSDKPALILEPPQAKIETWKKRLDELEKKGNNIVVNSLQTQGSATDLGKEIKGILDEAEGLRTGIVKPVNDIVDRINASFGTVTVRCKASIAIIKKKILDWRAVEEERLRKEQAKAEAKAAKKGQAAPAQQALANTAVGKNSTSSISKKWTFEIVDQKLIPDDYWQVNEKAIQFSVDAGVRQIPGVKIFQKANVRIG